MPSLMVRVPRRVLAAAAFMGAGHATQGHNLGVQMVVLVTALAIVVLVAALALVLVLVSLVAMVGSR